LGSKVPSRGAILIAVCINVNDSDSGVFALFKLKRRLRGGSRGGGSGSANIVANVGALFALELGPVALAVSREWEERRGRCSWQVLCLRRSEREW
jgi:hypothetical protein